MQLLAQANRKRELVQKGTLSLLYRPYWKLTPEEARQRVELIQHFIDSNHHDAAVGTFSTSGFLDFVTVLLCIFNLILDSTF